MNTESKPRLRTIARRVAEHIHSEWERIESESSQQGQLYQSRDAEIEFHLWQLEDILEREIRSVVCECADVCNSRSESHSREERIGVANEARKCSAAVLHTMLAVTGKSEVCLKCDGRGCDSCFRGARLYRTT